MPYDSIHKLLLGTHREKPENLPEIISFRLENAQKKRNEYHRVEKVINRLWQHYKVAGIRTIHVISFYTHPGKSWSIETKQRVRRLRLAQKLYKKYPLFAFELYKQTLNKKPDYFGVLHDCETEFNMWQKSGKLR